MIRITPAVMSDAKEPASESRAYFELGTPFADVICVSLSVPCPSECTWFVVVSGKVKLLLSRSESESE